MQMLYQFNPCFFIAEKMSHANQEFSEQNIDFMRIFLHVANVVIRYFNLMDIHSSFDTTVQRVDFIG